MSRLLKIGDLSKQTGLSIRTLHYYDEIQLMTPSLRSEAGHRLYSDSDIVRLQQILSLRQLGLSLSEIRDCLENPDYSLSQVIDLHRNRLREQISLSHTLLKRLDNIALTLKKNQSVAVENLIQAMETMTMSTQYFTAEQQDIINTRFQEVEEEWQKILSEIRTEMDKGRALNSPSVRMLARRWLWSMRSIVKGDGEIYESLMNRYQKEGNIAEDWGMNSAEFDFLLKAIFSMALGDTTESLVPRHKIFSDQTQAVIRLGEVPIREINLDVLGTEGILLGLLAEGKNAAAQALAVVDISYERVYPIVKSWLGNLPKSFEEPFPQLPFAPRAKRVIEIALEEAKAVGRSHIEPEHLLLGILKEYKECPPPGGVAARILKEELNVDLPQLEQQVRTKIAQTR